VLDTYRSARLLLAGRAAQNADGPRDDLHPGRMCLVDHLLGGEWLVAGVDDRAALRSPCRGEIASVLKDLAARMRLPRSRLMSMPPSQGDAPGWPACRRVPLVSATIGSCGSSWHLRISAPQSKLWIVTLPSSGRCSGRWAPGAAVERLDLGEGEVLDELAQVGELRAAGDGGRGVLADHRVVLRSWVVATAWPSSVICRSSSKVVTPSSGGTEIWSGPMYLAGTPRLSVRGTQPTIGHRCRLHTSQRAACRWACGSLTAQPPVITTRSPHHPPTQPGPVSHSGRRARATRCALPHQVEVVVIG
jgi:hypothetical protein